MVSAVVQCGIKVYAAPIQRRFGDSMFENLFEDEGHEQWQIPPAPTEELPPGLIEDEI
jgi:hypothetical protein